MILFGITIPLWALLIGAILVAVVAWKLIKFAIKLLIMLVVAALAIIGLDLAGVFDALQDVLFSLV